MMVGQRDAIIWAVSSAVILAAFVAGSMYTKRQHSLNPFSDKGLLKLGANLPPIWLFYNTGDVNARAWSDFGGRSSRALNVPYLNLAYDSITRHNAGKYRIEVINGISGLAELLGWDAIPEPMKTVERDMNVAEMNWIRAAILARFGGLWLEPSSICLKGFGDLPADKVMFFGTDLDEAIGGDAGTRVPGLRAVWAPVAGHKIFMNWADDAWNQVSGRKAGHLGSAEKWSYLAFADEGGASIVNVHGECGRKGNKRIELDDLFETGAIPFEIAAEAIYVPVPLVELCRRRSLLWFLRMSEEQVMESDMVITRLLAM